MPRNREIISPIMVERAREFRKAPTPSEEKAWEILRDRRCLGLKFKRQHIIKGFFVDFYCHELRLILEIDGKVHEKPDQAEYDQQRSDYLEQRGYRMLRISNDDVCKDFLEKALLPFLSP